MKDLLVYFKGYIKETILGPVFKLLEASFELLVPLMIAGMIDQIIPKKDQGGLVLLVFYLFLLAALGALLALVAQYVSSKAAVGYTQKLTDALFEKVLKLSQIDKERLGTSSLLTRLTGDTFQIQTGINLFLRLFLRAPIIIIGATIMAVRISPQVTAWFIGMVLVLSGIVFIISRKSAPLYQSVRKQLDQLVFLSREQLTGMRVIRAFGQSQSEIAEFLEQNKAYLNLQLSQGYWSASLSPLTFLVVNLCLLGLVWQGSHLVLGGQLSQGLLLALINYLLQILSELLKAAILVTNLNQSYIAAKRVQEVFLADEEDIKAPLIQMSLPISQVFSMSNLTLNYPGAGAPALEGISANIESGQIFGIIGGTGSGKTTLVDLLAGLRTPTSGQLVFSLEGQSVPNLETWRSWAALVPQKAQLFQGSIRDNLLLGIEGALPSDEDLWNVLTLAQAADFVREKEGGLDAEVAAFGRNFSGGQRQRLTIARALLRKAPVLILDDATSALDYVTESRLMQALKSCDQIKTLIMVSQRTRSLVDAGAILVLEQGRQVAFGKHEELIVSSSIYRDIHLSQYSQKEVSHGKN